MPDRELVPITEAAARTGVSRRTIQRWIAEGRLKRYRQLGDRRSYVDVGKLRRLMELKPG